MTTRQSTPPAQRPAGEEHPNARRLREAFAAFGRGDLDVVRERLADDIVWTNGGHADLAGTYQGWDAVVEMFGRLFALTDGTYSVSLLSCLADDARAVGVYDATWTISAKTATHRFVLVDDVEPDGTVSRTHVLAFDQEAADADLPG